MSHVDTIRDALDARLWVGKYANDPGVPAALEALDALVAEIQQQADRIAWLEGDVAGWRIKNQQLRDALERLGSNACFTSPFSYDTHTAIGAELKARTDFARNAAALAGTPSEKPNEADIARGHELAEKYGWADGTPSEDA